MFKKLLNKFINWLAKDGEYICGHCHEVYTNYDRFNYHRYRSESVCAYKNKQEIEEYNRKHGYIN